MSDSIVPNQIAPAILIRVVNGKNILTDSEYSRRDKLGDVEYFGSVSLKGKDLVQYEQNEDYTDLGLFKYNYNRDSKFIHSYLYDFQKIMIDDTTSFPTLVDSLKSFWELLGSGDYILSLRKMIPTDGEGNYFGVFNPKPARHLMESQIYLAEDLENEGFEESDPYKLYLVPTQKEEFDISILNELRNQTDLGIGISYGLQGFASVLLDGHHKAKVAYEKKEFLKCIEIEKVESIKDNFQRLPIDSKSSVQVKDFFYGLKFLDFPNVDDLASLDLIASEIDKNMLLDLENDSEDLPSHSQLLRIVFTLFFKFPKDSFVRIEPTIQKIYYTDVHRLYYSLLVNYLDDQRVYDILMNVLISNSESDKSLNDFIATNLGEVS